MSTQAESLVKPGTERSKAILLYFSSPVLLVTHNVSEAIVPCQKFSFKHMGFHACVIVSVGFLHGRRSHFTESSLLKRRGELLVCA